MLAILHLLYSLTLQAGYGRADLGVVYPIARGIGPLLTIVLAVIALGERPTLLASIGALVILIGILVVTGNPLRNAGNHPLRRITWGTATGATIAAYTLWDAFAIGSLGLAPTSYYAGTLLIQVALLAPGITRRREAFAHATHVNRTPIIVVAVLPQLAYILVLTAMQTSPVALVAPLREASIVISALLARRLVGSMGRVASCGDNAAMESFFALLQKNVLNRRSWVTRDELRIAIVTWIERTYHRHRRQAVLGRLTPTEFEAIMNTPAALAA